MRVSTGPGHTAFTRIPWRATSPAAALVSPITACFEATIVEEAVDPAVSLDRHRHISLHVRRLGDIGAHRNRVPAVLADDAGGRFGTRAVAVDHHRLRTVAGEGCGCRAADSIAAAGDQRNLAGEIHLDRLRPNFH